MASTQRKTTTSSSGNRSRASSASKSGGGKRAASQTKGRSSSRRSAPQRRPYRREIGGAVFLLLALFGAIGYFKTDEGAVIALFCNLLKGLCGYGFYITPPLFLAAAGILIFHRGRPVRLLWTDRQVRAQALDVDGQFGLVVRLEDGSTTTLRTGEVSVRGLYGYV